MGVDPHANLILSHGQLLMLPVKMRRGKHNRCHGNAADIWARSPDKYQLVTGYGLNDKIWRSHTWVVDGKFIYETTTSRERYFGVVLEPGAATKFWLANYEPLRDPERTLTPAFFKPYQRILPLMAQLLEEARRTANIGNRAG